MKSRYRSSPFRFAAGLLASAAAIGLSGCVVVGATAVAAGTVAYLQGDLNATIAADVAAVARATERTIKDMKLVEISNKQDALTAAFVARNAKDDSITIHLTRDTATQTKVQIRVGLTGDEQLSRAILDAIQANL